MSTLPIESILEGPATEPRSEGVEIGRSREDREILAYEIGRGSLRVSLIGGCHADEPVGPTMLRRLIRFLEEAESVSPWIDEIQWSIVPHVNPDGEARNRGWSTDTIAIDDHTGAADLAYDVASYTLQVVRELPGDDIEFGFPRAPSDDSARPENQAVAEFLRRRGPFHLHGTFHGMGLAPGPWFLIEPAWIDRTRELRRSLRRKVRTMGYPLFDVDRQGEKGFRRIDTGFSTRPDSVAMRSYFLERNDPETAALFRPSSMEFVRALGGDPLTIVSEMPLFLLPESKDASRRLGFRAGTEGRRSLLAELQRRLEGRDPRNSHGELERLGIRPMPLRDQMRLQLAFLSAALAAVQGQS